MNIFLVTFRAYDRQFTEPYLDKSMLYIHSELHDLCNTYVPIKIVQIELTSEINAKAQQIDIEELNKLKAETHEQTK